MQSASLVRYALPKTIGNPPASPMLWIDPEPLPSSNIRGDLADTYIYMTLLSFFSTEVVTPLALVILKMSKLEPLPLPQGIREAYIPSDDLTYHVLEAGFDSPHPRPLLLLIHGFPEMAYSWRKVMVPLADAGYHVVAYDQRGYGRTTGWDTRPFTEGNLTSFSFTILVRDAMVLINALGYRDVAAVIGHDFGAVTAAMCALIRPDVFKRYKERSVDKLQG
jgi:hypothetical protein